MQFYGTRQQPKDPNNAKTYLGLGGGTASAILGILLAFDLHTPLQQLTGVLASLTVGAAITKVAIDRDRGMISNWLLAFLSVAGMTILLFIITLANQDNVQSKTRQQQSSPQQDETNTTPDTDTNSESPPNIFPKSTSNSPSTEVVTTSPYKLKWSAKPLVIPVPETCASVGDYVADLDLPQVGTSISGDDVGVPCEFPRRFEGDGASDTTIALAPAALPEPDTCSTLTREQPIDRVELDELAPGQTAFCLITDNNAVAYLKYLGTRNGTDLKFELTLWQPN